MKKVLIIATLGFSLAGCVTGGTGIFSSYQNPVNTTRLAQAESAYGVALSIAVGYRNSCNKKLIPVSCRSIVAQLQKTDKEAQATLVQARAFIKNNPTLDATSVIDAATRAVSVFQSIITINGVK